MERIWRSCRTVSGMVATRTNTVNRMMANPIWEKHRTYNTSRVLSIGLMMISLQRSPKMAKTSTYIVLSTMPPIWWLVAPGLFAGVVAPKDVDPRKDLNPAHLAVIGSYVHGIGGNG